MHHIATNKMLYEKTKGEMETAEKGFSSIAKIIDRYIVAQISNDDVEDDFINSVCQKLQTLSSIGLTNKYAHFLIILANI
jgi:hypothetical protein